MTEEKQNERPNMVWPKIVFPFFVAALLVVAAFFAGKYYAEKNTVYDTIESSKTIDSLERAYDMLADSISRRDVKISESRAARVRAQERYDTIKVLLEPEDVTKALNKILNTPPR